ncbi:thioredoxin family protein [Sphingobacterium deserti]|uniref:Thioredoxin domain-containing protein n=1 Tax=Sphingobacterium deserti TaxID=1229276 RepID=A0A0B8T9E7_9SPHI|nr:thioredoxin family protein [Sphingobacterium deserti]KGE15354.1 thioredoxin domain-containing protein [Sphingobacterium deserti]
MKKLILTLLIILPILTFAQEKGIAFEHQTTWAKVKAKAKAENKHIFVDCFTTWCGPCKYMSSTIFPQEKVGDFFNKNFVNLKLQMDQTKDDNEEVKSWYDEASRFATDYAVRAYPTFLIFSPDGELVHRIIGGGEADDFIAKAQAGLDPETQYITLVKQFEKNPQDAEIAKKTAKAAKLAYDQDLEKKAAARYIDLVGGETLLTTEGIQFLVQGATSSKSAAYGIIKNNTAKVDELLQAKNRKANDILSSVLATELIVPQLKDNNNVDFAALKRDIEKNHPEVNMSGILANIKTQYYFNKKNWPAFKDAVNEFIALDDNKVSPMSLNQFAWSVFENCDDPACLQAALDWSKKSLEKNEDPAFLDTYANLLYKSGDKDKAIEWQEKAIAKANEKDKEAYVATLDKMKKGEQTW